MSALLWALIALPLGAGTVLGLGGRRVNAVAPLAATAVAAVTLGLAVAVALARPGAEAPLFTGVRAGLRVDGLSAVMVVTVAAVTTAVLAFSTAELGRDENRGRFYGVMLLFAGAMLVTVTATTLPFLLMAWELMGATSWALIGYWWRQPHRAGAADTAFLTTRAADLGLYLAAGAAMAGGVGSLRLDALPHTGGAWLHVVSAGVVVAALGKSAQLPFSFWLSRAMEGPSPVSALLHSATMVAAGAYLLLRLHPLLTATDWAGPLVAWTGAVSALALGLVAVAQRDLKQLLAASTSAQLGFMVLAAGSRGVAAGTVQLVAHAAVKSGLFLVAGAWLTVLGTEQLPALRGAARGRPLVGAAFTVGALTLAGLPPLSLWAAKDEVLAAARAESPGLYAVGLAAGAVSAVYSVKALWYVTRPLPAGPAAGHGAEQSAGRGTAQRGTGHLARWAHLPLWVLTAAAAVLGVLALPGPADWLRTLLGARGEPSPHPWEAGVSAVLALGTVAATWWWLSRTPRTERAAAPWAEGWLHLERAAHALLVRPVMGLARALAAFDDRVVDGAVRQLARGGPALSRLAGRVDDGGLDAAVGAVASGARRLGSWARRPQTGLLHQYYAQAVVGFALLTLIVLLVR
ncbi:NADH-quinone oxidoreductase subunit L [Streptomyces sp. RK75]|uniref:NADH-quinone oxidoreductase subunit 5 family protein n=1 Tax=Streptomyces sp. RK75 TaxID=2824895 RepID=UPI001B36C118|nr:proton-conducting transporter membrane subunit [Streptomyces sp. RK75]MBQ0862754.1 NADH-quinone oxidoreductase subunit L [Streptomyces sp. RK75]